MKRRIGLVTLVVRDYDEALAFYRDKLGFTVAEDTDLGGGKRWLVVGPAETDAGGCRLLLAQASNDAQADRAGDQTGGRVGFFLETDDFERDLAAFSAAGVRFLGPPRHEPYGTVAVFADLYGNTWDLIEHAR